MLRLAPALTPEIAVLLGRAMFPDPARIERALEAYRTEDSRQLFVWEVGGQIVSAAALRSNGQKAEVLHIGTRPDAGGRGYGRGLLHAIAAHLNLSQLTAETDDESVEFYRRSGFEIAEAPARGGRRRFWCVLSLP
ncbi:GNAT family N-acetyltransferase [Deinococcus sp. SM5_A1]|uniref:GNAT family N-acetyltransferase n=1 Tax=Deinococcus sp. SM5_A1 TaxID=3379094 RepID=UPI00385DF783